MNNGINTVNEVKIYNRSAIHLSGVVEVGAFNTEAIIMKTTLGQLTLTGENLNILKLSSETGEMDIEGKLNSLVYSDDSEDKKGRKSGFLYDLFR